MRKHLFLSLVLGLIGIGAVRAAEIRVDLRLDQSVYVIGESVRGVVNVRNLSPEIIHCNEALGAPDKMLIEIIRASNHEELDKLTKTPITCSFLLKANEGQKMEVRLADHFPLRQQGKFLARPVLVHDGSRYEGQYRAFDLVPGIEMASALQLFSNRPGQKRRFRLMRWTRNGTENLFLTSQDEGTSTRQWATWDLGAVMKSTPPIISISKDGRVVVIHRLGPDDFVRSEFWSLLDRLEFRSVERVADPETAGQNRVRELYKGESVAPAHRPWWKFW